MDEALSDEMVEAAARAIAASEIGCDIFPDCVTAESEIGCACRKDARDALTASRPFDPLVAECARQRKALAEQTEMARKWKNREASQRKQARKLRGENEQLRQRSEHHESFLREIAYDCIGNQPGFTEGGVCEYFGHDGPRNMMDEECAGAVCWAKRALTPPVTETDERLTRG